MKKDMEINLDKCYFCKSKSIKKIESISSVKNVIFATGHLSEQIKNYCSKIDYSKNFIFANEKEKLDTGGALKNACLYSTSKTCLAFNGDCFCDADINILKDYHIEKQADFTILALKMLNANRYGSIMFNDNNEILKFAEKSTSQLESHINVGFYCFNKKIIDDYDKKIFSLEQDFFPSLIKNQRPFYAMPFNGRFIDIGTENSYKEAQQFFKEAQTHAKYLI